MANKFCPRDHHGELHLGDTRGRLQQVINRGWATPATLAQLAAAENMLARLPESDVTFPPVESDPATD